MKRLALLALALLVGCGAGHKAAPKANRTAGAPPASTQQRVVMCPPGGGAMGCSINHAAIPHAHFPTAELAGRKLVDVSLYQGHPDWPAAIRWGIVGAILKAGEYREDPDFAYNAARLNTLHLWWAAYWFERGYSCKTQADAFVSIVSPFHPPGPYVIDAEVPEARGQVPCTAAEIKRLTGWNVVVEYTGSGTDPGGGHADLLWDAAYGPTQHGCAWTCSVVAWQFTGDGAGQYPHYIPGIGNNIDISIDYGITKLRLGPPPDRYAIFPNRLYPLAGLWVNEHATVQAWDAHQCRNPVRRLFCQNARIKLSLERDRIWFIAHHTRDLRRPLRKPRWGDYPGQPLGQRFGEITRRLVQR